MWVLIAVMPPKIVNEYVRVRLYNIFFSFFFLCAGFLSPFCNVYDVSIQFPRYALKNCMLFSSRTPTNTIHTPVKTHKKNIHTCIYIIIKWRVGFRFGCVYRYIDMSPAQRSTDVSTKKIAVIRHLSRGQIIISSMYAHLYINIVVIAKSEYYNNNNSNSIKHAR